MSQPTLFPEHDPDDLALRHLRWDAVRVQTLLELGANVVASTSGGKDSQAMLVHLARTVGPERIVAVTADLGTMEWPDAVAHARAQAEALGIEHHVVQPVRPLLESIRRRGKWPAMGARYCTSDHKRAPIWKFIRRRFGRRGLVLSAVGERWEENSHPGAARCTRPSCRCQRRALETIDGLSIVGREVHAWRPILDWSTEQVFGQIRAAGQDPHPLYARGLTRFSCSFCVFGRMGDLRLAKAERPDLYAEIVGLERDMGHTFRQGFRLADLDTARDDGLAGPP